MKKTIFKVVFLAFLCITIAACSKDDEPTAPTYQEENFLDGYLTATGFSQRNTDFINSGSYEFGLEFTPTVTGSITSLRMKLPDANPSLRITIWDKLAGTVIKTEIVNVALANTVYNFDIVDIPLVKDKEYTITMNSDDWYNRQKTDLSVATYPVVVGNIKINKYIWDAGTAQVYPTRTNADYFAGDISFNFLQQ